jgi:hypothetical protein
MHCTATWMSVLSMDNSPTAWLGGGDDRRSALPHNDSQSRLKPAHGLGGQALTRASRRVYRFDFAVSL